MKQAVFLLIIIFTGALPVIAFSQQKDSIFLYNGQLLIGDIKNAKFGIITIDDVDLNLLSIKLYKIKVLRTVQRFRIETNDKLIYYGTLTESKTDGWTKVITDNGETTLIPITSIAAMAFLENKFLKQLDGNIGAGFSFTKSNGIGQVNLNSTINYANKDFENQFKASTIGSIDSSRYSRDNEIAELFSNYNFNTTWFAAGLLAYQRNLELSLKRRFQELLGAGNKLIIKKNMQLLAVTGVSLSQEKNIDNAESGVLVEIPAMVRFNFYNFTHPNIQISTSQSIYFGITQAGRVRYSGSTDFSWELIKNFAFTLNFYNNYDSKPPINSASKIDFGIVMGLAYKF